MILIKLLINIYDTTIFQCLGIFIILLAIYSYHKTKNNYMISEFNIFDGKDIKDIEMFKYSIEKQKLKNDFFLNKKINQKETISLYALLYNILISYRKINRE